MRRWGCLLERRKWRWVPALITLREGRRHPAAELFIREHTTIVRPEYGSGQRGSHLVARLDRLESCLDNAENPILSFLPDMMMNSCVVAQGDVVNFLPWQIYDPKVVAAEHKSSLQGDFRRHMNVALGISGDDSPTVSSRGKLLPEDVKRVKAILRETIVKARIFVVATYFTKSHTCYP